MMNHGHEIPADIRDIVAVSLWHVYLQFRVAG